MALSGRGSAEASGTTTHKAFTAYDIQACLYDAERVEYLRAAIFDAVKDGDVVVDAGSGTGLLGMFAAQAGAKRVYCLELNADFIPVIRENAQRNGFGDKIIAIEADATEFDLKEYATERGLEDTVDVVISEVISAGFFYEPQLQIVSNLRRFLEPGGKIVPAVMNNYVELIAAQDTLYGLTLDFDSRFTELDGDRSLTTRERYLATNFRKATEPEIDETVRVTAQFDGATAAVATAVKITYDIEFTPRVLADKPTEFLLNPQIIFLPHSVELRAGESYDVRLTYAGSDAPLSCEIVVSPVALGG